MIERGRREQSRLRVRLPCRLITRGADCAAVLADLSRTGAKIQLDAAAALHGDGVLQWFDMEAFGTIVWTRSGFCGVHFFDPLPDSWILASRNFNETSFYQGESAAARELARQWVSGARRV